MENYKREGYALELVENIAALLGVILSAITLITLCTKGGRAVLKGIFSRQAKDIIEENKQQEADIKAISGKLDDVLATTSVLRLVAVQQLRDTIKTIYYKYQAEKKIPLYERKTADKTYKIYHEKFKENTYATLLYNEICKWEIDTLTYQDINED